MLIEKYSGFILSRSESCNILLSSSAVSERGGVGGTPYDVHSCAQTTSDVREGGNERNPNPQSFLKPELPERRKWNGPPVFPGRP